MIRRYEKEAPCNVKKNQTRLPFCHHISQSPRHAVTQGDKYEDYSIPIR